MVKPNDVAVARDTGETVSGGLFDLYNKHFTQLPGAVQSASASGSFRIFSAIDYSVPISYSNSSQKLSIR